ncbi:MAG: nuclear transport factor 2 family protein [Candidatus Tectomicrobia bacterium]
MTREEKVAVVERYISGLGKGDFSHVPFADDVSYESPLTPKRVGKEAIDFLSSLFPIMRGAEVQQHIVEGEYVATVFHLKTPNGVTAVFDKFRVVDGTLKEINPYYDPSVLNEAVQQLQ